MPPRVLPVTGTRARRGGRGVLALVVALALATGGTVLAGRLIARDRGPAGVSTPAATVATTAATIEDAGSFVIVSGSATAVRPAVGPIVVGVLLAAMTAALGLALITCTDRRSRPALATVPRARRVRAPPR